jgi:Amt family ammonium transporter
MIILITFWLLIVYCPIAHSTWHPQGWLFKLGVLDYAGGNVVHICSGMSGLATALVIGYYTRGVTTPDSEVTPVRKSQPNNILLTFMGMSFLWFACYGFNAGSAYGANENAAYALLATQIATSISALMWMLIDWAVYKTPSTLSMMSGAIAGLACISPAAGYVDMTGAFFIGFFGGPLCFLGAQLIFYFGFDDALDSFSVHATGGIIGYRYIFMNLYTHIVYI